MSTSFMDKFKGKTNKISKQGYSGVVIPQAVKHPKQGDNQLLQLEIVKQNKRQKKKKIALQTKQNNFTKHTSKSTSELRRNKDHNYLVQKRTALKDKSFRINDLNKKQQIKLPKIVPQINRNSLLKDINEKYSKINKQKNVITESDQCTLHNKYMAKFLDDSALEQFQKLQSFEYSLQKRKDRSKLDQSVHFSRKGATVYY